MTESKKSGGGLGAAFGQLPHLIGRLRKQVSVVRNFRVEPDILDVAFTEEIRERIGDTRVRTSSEAAEWQATIEKAIHKKLSFKISSGDLIYAQFDKLPEYRTRNPSKVNQSIGHNLVGHYP